MINKGSISFTFIFFLSFSFLFNSFISFTETLFTKVSMGEYMESFYDLIRVNAANDTIAIFKKHGTSFILDRIYDVKEHSMIPEDFKDIVFKDKFSPLKLDKNMQLVKRNKRGAVYWQV